MQQVGTELTYHVEDNSALSSRPDGNEGQNAQKWMIFKTGWAFHFNVVYHSVLCFFVLFCFGHGDTIPGAKK